MLFNSFFSVMSLPADEFTQIVSFQIQWCSFLLCSVPTVSCHTTRPILYYCNQATLTSNTLPLLCSSADIRQAFVGVDYVLLIKHHNSMFIMFFFQRTQLESLI